VGHKILEVGREEGLLVCLPLAIQLSANLNLCEQVLPFQISGAKAKNLTLRHPMNNSHVADPSQAFCTTPTQTP
jgi:hypothetical protein